MKILARSGWTKRTAFLAMLLLLQATALLTPAKVSALCCAGWRITERYYSNASHTTLVGTCIDDECAGTYTCTGQTTIYQVNTRSCCSPC